jgi:hypothetical protein
MSTACAAANNDYFLDFPRPHLTMEQYGESLAAAAFWCPVFRFSRYSAS